MARALIGRTVRRLRAERSLSQNTLATRLGISASYLNLIEHDQRAVTASLLIKLAETLRVDLGELSGTQERQLQVGLREAFADPQVVARGLRIDLPSKDAKGGTSPSVRAPMKIDGWNAHADFAAPRLGQHTDEVLGELGLSGEQIAALRASGAAG